jgi:hypothetical protein
MQEQELELAKRLCDDELVARLTCCVKEDREVTARLLVHLGEVDARGLFRDLGFSSMFDYAVQALHMSESEAWLRIRSARLAREFPMALGMVARGELHMTALKLLAPVLTPSNVELLDKARFKSKLEIQALIATHFPLPDVQSAIRKLPTPRSASATAHMQLASNSARQCSGAEAAEPEHVPVLAFGLATSKASGHATHSASVGIATLAGSQHAAHSASESNECDALPVARVRGTQTAGFGGRSLVAATAASSIVPLSPGRYKVQFTASEALVDKVNEARDLLQNQVLNGELAIIVDRALDLLIAERKKQLFAQTSKPRTQRHSASDSTADKVEPATPVARAEPRGSNPNTRHIAHALRRQVYERDAGRCCFVSTDGRRCGARGNLEFHHITPFARGGEATLENICLMCRSHNSLIAERDYGREFVKRCISERGSAPSLRSQERSRRRADAEQIGRAKASRSGPPASTLPRVHAHHVAGQTLVGLGPDHRDLRSALAGGAVSQGQTGAGAACDGAGTVTRT